MKYIVLLLLLTGCRIKEDNVYPFIPGTYSRFAAHAFGKEQDTLIVKEITHGVFEITRKWKYERILDGTAVTPEYKVTILSAVYDPERYWLQEKPGGSIYTFDVYAKLLFNGPTKYNKQ